MRVVWRVVRGSWVRLVVSGEALVRRVWRVGLFWRDSGVLVSFEGFRG